MNTTPQLIRKSLCWTVWLLFSFAGAAPLWSQPAQTDAVQRTIPPGGPISQPNLNFQSTEAIWHAFRQAPLGSTSQAEAFSNLESARLELGLPSLLNHSLVLTRMAERARQEGQTDTAQQLLDWAQHLAPDDPSSPFARAGHYYQTKPWALFSILSELGRGYRLALTTPNTAPLFGTHLYSMLLKMIIWLTAVFLLTQLIRHTRLVVHDLSSILAHVIPLHLIYLSLGALIALLALLTASILLVVLALVALVWLYQSSNERIITVVLLVLMAIVPLLLSHQASWMVAAQSNSALLYRAENGLCERACQGRLADLLAAHPEDPYIRFTNALTRYRLGSQRELENARTIIDQGSYPEDIAPSVELLKANLDFLRGATEDARRRYRSLSESTAAVTSIRAAAHFNLHRIGRELNQPADQHLSLAQQLDERQTVALLQSSARRTHRYLANSGTPPATLTNRARSSEERMLAEASQELWRPYAGNIRQQTAQLAIVILALVLGLIASLTRKFKPSTHCPKCNGVLSLRDAPLAAKANYCQSCYLLFMDAASLEHKERKQLQRRLDIKRSILRISTIIGNLLGAGVGFLLRGRAALGMLLTIPLLLALVLLLNPPPLAVAPFDMGTGAFDGRNLVATFILIVTLPTSWVLTWLGRKRL